MGIKELSIGLILVGLFAFALVTFAYQSQIENNVNPTILDDPNYPAFAGLNDSLSANLQSDAKIAVDSRGDFEEQQGSTGEAGTVATIFSPVKNFGSFVFGTFNILKNSIAPVIGINGIVLTVIGGALSLIIALLIWRTLRAGGT